MKTLINRILFKNKIEKLTSKIAEKNLLLLDVSERNSEYYLEKLSR